MIRFSDEDRRRMRAEQAERADINAELIRLHHKYARIARRPANAAEVERVRRLTRVREKLQIRPHGDD